MVHLMAGSYGLWTTPKGHNAQTWEANEVTGGRHAHLSSIRCLGAWGALL